jgi:predicted amidophosphoribosyltransferase
LPCPAADAPWDQAGAAVRHGAEASALVVEFKQSGSGRIANVIVDAIVRADLMRVSAAGDLAVIPVPMDPRRKRKTGVDHASILAKAVAARICRPVAQPLGRRAAPSGVRQAGAARRERLQAQRIRVYAREPAPTSCLVVDDVHTTGATLRAVAKSLREAGAETVNCMTFARALPPAYAGLSPGTW